MDVFEYTYIRIIIYIEIDRYEIKGLNVWYTYIYNISNEKNMPALHILDTYITQNIIMENRLLIEQLKLNLGCDFEYNSIINFAGDE